VKAALSDFFLQLILLLLFDKNALLEVENLFCLLFALLFSDISRLHDLLQEPLLLLGKVVNAIDHLRLIFIGLFHGFLCYATR